MSGNDLEVLAMSVALMMIAIGVFLLALAGVVTFICWCIEKLYDPPPLHRPWGRWK